MIISCDTCQLQYDVRAYPAGTQVRCRCESVLTVPEHVVATIRCPSCGGTVDAQSQRCQFCQSMITRKSCPKCFASVREEAKFCDSCGEPLRALSSEMIRATDHACPRCKVPLFHQVCSGYAVEACAECMGIWITHETLEHVYRDAPKEVASVQVNKIAVADPTKATERVVPGAAAYIPCPTCAKMMNPTNYARRSGIIIDVCREHGTWFDADELNKILEFNAKGGVEEARKRDLELAKMDVEKQRFLQRMEEQQMRRLESQERAGGLFGRSLRGFRF